jgi:hypothetical protein
MEFSYSYFTKTNYEMAHPAAAVYELIYAPFKLKNEYYI